LQLEYYVGGRKGYAPSFPALPAWLCKTSNLFLSVGRQRVINTNLSSQKCGLFQQMYCHKHTRTCLKVECLVDSFQNWAGHMIWVQDKTGESWMKYINASCYSLYWPAVGIMMLPTS
jgi:hypothetical protein